MKKAILRRSAEIFGETQQRQGMETVVELHVRKLKDGLENYENLDRFYTHSFTGDHIFTSLYSTQWSQNMVKQST